MFDQYKKLLGLQFKKIEINYRTWKNAQEIARAYNQDISFKKSFSTFFEAHSRLIILIVSVVFISTFLGIGMWFIIKETKKNYETASIHKVVKIKNMAASERHPKPLSSATSSSKNAINAGPTMISNNYVTKNPMEKKTEIASSAPEKDVGLTFFSKVKILFSRLNYRTVATPESLQKNNKDQQSGTQAAAKDAGLLVPNVNTKQKPESGVSISQTPAPAQVRKSAIKADYYTLLANKSNHALYLLHQNEHQEWKIVKQFDIAVGGGQSGHKVSAGDRRTPEGLYFILLRKEKNELTSIYGPLAFVLNYPNETDKKEGRTGQGIWIHGTLGDGKPVPTKGCVSLANNDILDLSKYIETGVGTPILIVNDSLMNDPLSKPDFELVDKKRKELIESQNQLLASIKGFLVDWVKAWESRDIGQYQQFYSISHFNSQGMNWTAWKEKKIQTFQAYHTIEVTINNIKISDWTDTNIEIKFLQNYKSDQKYFENGKKLFLEKDNGKWEITREITIPKEELLL